MWNCASAKCISPIYWQRQTLSYMRFSTWKIILYTKSELVDWWKHHFLISDGRKRAELWSLNDTLINNAWIIQVHASVRQGWLIFRDGCTWFGRLLFRMMFLREFGIYLPTRTMFVWQEGQEHTPCVTVCMLQCIYWKKNLKKCSWKLTFPPSLLFQAQRYTLYR